MSQGVWSTINPETTSGTMLAGLLTDFKDAIMTGFAGTSRPSQIEAGGTWIDTTSQGAPNYQWIYKLWTGTVDVEIFRISILSGFGGALTAKDSFEVRQYSGDTDFGILELVKQRLPTASNGQVLSGDVVAEYRFVGRTATGTSPTVAHMRFTATDDQTTAEYGGTFSFFSTPDASAVITEHMRFIASLVETLVPHKINSLQLVGQDVATTATINPLSASKVLVEFTGATATAIQGIDNAAATQMIILHNRSSAVVTLNHLDLAATANQRMKFPNGSNYQLGVDGSVCLYYCTTESLWKLRWSGSPKTAITRTLTTIKGTLNQWTAPAEVNRVRIVTYRNRFYPFNGSSFTDNFGNMYIWGVNSIAGVLGVGDLANRSSPVAVLGGLNCQPNLSEYTGKPSIIDTKGDVYLWGFGSSGILGDGTTTNKSSPVVAIGGLKFTALFVSNTSAMALTESGKAYAWGANGNGSLGDGTVAAKSSPVAVLGDLRFTRISTGNAQTSGNGHAFIGLTKDGVAYAWGNNNFGNLGLGDVTPRSSPVAVLGGLTFKKIESGYDSTSGYQGMYSYGLTPAGVLYMWGANTKGSLGVGDTTPRSSPVAVLGGLNFVDVRTGFSAAGVLFALTEDGTLYAWGANAHGQLGVGDTVARSSPVAVLGGLKFIAVYPTQTNCYALTEDGDLYAWGNNQQGALGVGDVTPRSSPVAVLGGLKFCGFTSITGVLSHGMTKDGSVYSWGESNDLGELGIGPAPDTGYSSPILVVGPAGGRADIPHQVTVVDVVPGQTYDVLLAQNMSYFGSTPIGVNVDSATIEYDK